MNVTVKHGPWSSAYGRNLVTFTVEETGATFTTPFPVSRSELHDLLIRESHVVDAMP